MHVKRPLVIAREGGWNKESKPKFKEQFEERYGRGNETTDGPIIKDPKTTIDTLDLSPADAQLLESREYQVTDIAPSIGVAKYLVNQEAKNTSEGGKAVHAAKGRGEAEG